MLSGSLFAKLFVIDDDDSFFYYNCFLAFLPLLDRTVEEQVSQSIAVLYVTVLSDNDSFEKKTETETLETIVLYFQP